MCLSVSRCVAVGGEGREENEVTGPPLFFLPSTEHAPQPTGQCPGEAPPELPATGPPWMRRGQVPGALGQRRPHGHTAHLGLPLLQPLGLGHQWLQLWIRSLLRLDCMSLVGGWDGRASVPGRGHVPTRMLGGVEAIVGTHTAFVLDRIGGALYPTTGRCISPGRALFPGRHGVFFGLHSVSCMCLYV